MTYLSWFENFASKHERLSEKLVKQGLNQEEIIHYFRFENMVEKEPSFCELYKTDTKCHEIEILNCYLCACPNFRFFQEPQQKEEKTLHSTCSIHAKDGAVFEYENNQHQDCSNCTVPHHEPYINKQFSLNWKEIMQECIS